MDTRRTAPWTLAGPWTIVDTRNATRLYGGGDFMKGEKPKDRMRESHKRVRMMTPAEKKALWDEPGVPPKGAGCAKCRHMGCSKCGSGRDVD